MIVTREERGTPYFSGVFPRKGEAYNNIEPAENQTKSTLLASENRCEIAALNEDREFC
jgi:hypothetical protein